MPPAELALGYPLPSNGSLLFGDRGRLLTTDMYGAHNKLLPEAAFVVYQPPTPTLPRARLSHHQEWIDVVKTGNTTMANFAYSGRLTEAFLAGNVALRAQQTLNWDGEQMRVPNCPQADQFIHPHYRKGWEWH